MEMKKMQGEMTRRKKIKSDEEEEEEVAMRDKKE